MPILKVIAKEGETRLYGSDTDLLDALIGALDEDPGPITVMIHGYKYLPGHPDHCPFDKILSVAPVRPGPRVVSWPRRLGLRGRRGEGLGLAFVRNSVRRIGGTIDIESELGKGSTFLLKFPKRLILSEPGGVL